MWGNPWEPNRNVLAPHHQINIVPGTELVARTTYWLVIDLLGSATLRASVISGKAAPVRA